MSRVPTELKSAARRVRAGRRSGKPMTGSTSSSEAAADDFYARLPVFDSFARLTDASIYTPLPDGWVIGLADIERSTAAIEAGRYKAVNTAAAAVIAAVANALEGRDFPVRVRGRRGKLRRGASGRLRLRKPRLRPSRPGSGTISTSRCGLRSCLSTPCAARVSMCGSRGSRRPRTSPTRCSRAADWPGESSR